MDVDTSIPNLVSLACSLIVGVLRSPRGGSRIVDLRYGVPTVLFDRSHMPPLVLNLSGAELKTNEDNLLLQSRRPIKRRQPRSTLGE